MAEDIKGWTSLMAKLDALGGSHLEEAAKESVLMLALATTAAAKLFVPVDSGELRGSIHEAVEVDGSQAVGYSYTNSDHAAFVEFGTGPVGLQGGRSGSPVKVHYSLGPFLVKRGTGRPGEVVLSYEDYWVYCDEQGRFFATRGQPAKPFMYPAAKEVEKQAQKIMASAIKSYIAKATGGGR